MIITHEILHRLGLPVLGARIAVQGAGNVGGVAAKLLYDSGCKVVAISDVSGGLYEKSGLDVVEYNLSWEIRCKPEIKGKPPKRLPTVIQIL